MLFKCVCAVFVSQVAEVEVAKVRDEDCARQKLVREIKDQRPDSRYLLVWTIEGSQYLFNICFSPESFSEAKNTELAE